MDLEIKDLAFEVKASSDDTFEGYASVFRNKDSHGDIMQKGAFTKTLQESKRVKVLWQHNMNIPIGKPIAMSEDSNGLHVKAKISKTEKGKEAIILMKDGVLDEISIGFNTIKDEWDKKNNARLIQEVKLWEFSLVTFASNDQANVTGVKSMGDHILALNNWINGEMKAGSMLSAKNKQLVENAITSLKALLDAAEGNVEPFKKTLNQPTEEELKAAEECKAMLLEMQKFADNKLK